MLTTCLFFASLINPLSLEQFGATINSNIPVQNAARFNSSEPLRTNDFQALQQRAATNRQIVRMGAFYISQGPDGVGIALPASANNTATSISTNNVQLILGATGTSNFSITTNFLTTQAMTVTYSAGNNQTLIDYNIIGNAFHDVYYNGLTPTFSFQNATIQSIRIDNGVEQRAYSNIFIQPGRKFRLTLSTGQVFLLYADTNLSLTLSTDLTTFTSRFPYTGFLRIAAIQTSVPSTSGTATNPVDWATTIQQQTLPTTPLAMFMLWPVEWIERVGPQIRSFIQRRFNVPNCPIIAQLLPVLARTDFNGALSVFNQLLSIEATGQTTFNADTNAFLTYFFMVAARDLNSAIQSYQTPSTTLPLFSTNAIESTFDAHRSVIPISADITFSNNQHSWAYETSGGSGPLIIFPSWKTHTSIAGFGYADPIKGPLPGQTATNNQITFTEQAVPSWFSGNSFSYDLINFFPNFLNLSKNDLNRLSRLIPFVLQQSITEDGVLGTGQQAYRLALTAKVITFVLRQKNQSLGRIRPLTEPLINAVKAELTSWLQTRNVTDFFIGDSTTGGVTASLGMTQTTNNVDSIDNGNAIYNDHHLQYGYWLAAAAFVIEWDILFGTRNPWITLSIGSGFTNRDLVDMLWRDARNPDKADPQLPFNRHGNPWEGHSTQTGALYTPAATGRAQGSFAEDFHSWLATNLYARAVQKSPVSESFFSTLATFSQTNLQMTSAAGKLVYQDNHWLYSNPYSSNLTVGNVTDATTTSTNSIDSGTACSITVR